MHFKDAILDELARKANVAQFVSFNPQLKQRYARVYGLRPSHVFDNARDAIATVLRMSSAGSVNVRSFDPARPKSREFVYGLKNADEVEGTVKRLAAAGLHTIVNETIDVLDGGVSGVLLGNIIEFAPEDIPRCVEKPGTAALPRALGLDLLTAVYAFRPLLDIYLPKERIEFSLHPLRRGLRREHTIIWEKEVMEGARGKADIRWPNRFSSFIGDKAFGLLLADLLGLPVPETTVISRSVPPFQFGRPTGSAETWIRTCPRVQQPGRYTTKRGWMDPFKLLADEDPTGEFIASILSQNGIEAAYSGAVVAAERTNGAKPTLTIEGTLGFGDEFMVGRKKRSPLPSAIRTMVRQLYARAAKTLGPVRFEWVADARRTWIVQLHRGASPSSGRTVYPGQPRSYRRFDVDNGLEPLRALVDELDGKDEGIVLVGDVGITSHFGDVLRRARVPSYIEPAGSR